MKLTFDAAKRNGKLRLTFAATKGMENLAALVPEKKREQQQQQQKKKETSNSQQDSESRS